MLRTLKPTESIETGHLGGPFPYWKMIDGKVVLADSAEEMINLLPPEKRIINPGAAISLFVCNFINGNQTMVQGIQRMPWHAELTGEGKLTRKPPLPHGTRIEKPDKMAAGLRERLEQEIFNVARGRKRIFVLLSGGLDSRIMAGVLKKVEPQLSAKITCVTWGEPHSRDAAYASRIANWYGWDFVSVPYDAELVWKNINHGATFGGAEVAGLHYHGMHWLKTADPDDLALAASYGDMIGRAEFSGVHLTNQFRAPQFNRFDIIHPLLVKQALEIAERERETAWAGESDWVPEWVRIELDMGENYMRRFNCHTMDYVRQFCALHQVFTSDVVVSWMWSFSPDCRTDDIYCEVLKNLDQRLYSLPWARTGMGLDGTKETDPKLTKEFHQWGKWLRHDLRERIEELIFSRELAEFGLFDGPSVRRLWNKFLAQPSDQLLSGQQIVNVASIAIARKHFGLLPVRKGTPELDKILDLPRRNKRWMGAKLKRLKEIFAPRFEKPLFPGQRPEKM